MKKSFKNIIQKYIILKINSRTWSNGFKVPSENALATKFNCSRISAREAMQSLVYSGILIPKKGSGYIVSDLNSDASIRSFKESHDTFKTETQEIKINSWLKDLFDLKFSGNEKIFIKTYYDKKGIIAVQYTILNKNIIWDINEKGVKESITTLLAKQGVAIKYSNIKITTLKNKIDQLQKIAKKMGWNDNFYPVEIVSSFSNDGWVEKTVRITRPDILNLQFTKRNYL